MKYKAIIFDLDGVICRTDQYHYLAWKKLAAEIGVPFDEALNNQLRGIGRMESLEIILKGYKEAVTTDEKERYAAVKNDYYRRYLKQMSPRDLPSDVKSTLDLIRGKGYKIAIGSASKNTKYILERLGLDTYFDAVSDGTNITRSKPDPEVFLKASEFFNNRPGFLPGHRRRQSRHRSGHSRRDGQRRNWRRRTVSYRHLRARPARRPFKVPLIHCACCTPSVLKTLGFF